MASAEKVERGSSKLGSMRSIVMPEMGSAFKLGEGEGSVRGRWVGVSEKGNFLSL